MLKLKTILTEVLLQEALPLDKAKEYTSIKQNKSIIKRLDDIFKKLIELPNAKTSKRNERIYFPVTTSVGIPSASPVEKEVVLALPPDYKLKDYRAGIVTDKFGREVKLNKVLTKIGKSDLVNKVNTDKTRESSNVSDYIVVFSRHPYDIAGMSTDRGWTSCMNIYTGKYKKYVSKDIKEGSFVCYVTKSTDLNLNRPVARVLIKPYINTRNKEDVLYSLEGKYYGTTSHEIKKFVSDILDKVQVQKSGTFELVTSLYCDSGRTSITKLSPEIQRVFNGKTKPTTEGQVKSILQMLDVNKYTINSDLTVDVEGDVIISSENLKVIPVNFRKVGGVFACQNNKLTSLEGAPQQVGGDFWCQGNNLTSLEGAPQKVIGDFWCDNNKLTSLEGAPQKVGGHFSCTDNKLTSLEGAPKLVGRVFACSDNNLTTLKGAPQQVGGDFWCSYNKLTSLEGAPKEVGRDFWCDNNKLTSLEGAPQKVGGHFSCTDNKKQFTQSDVQFVSTVKGEIYHND